MKVIITRNTAIRGKSFAADPEKTVDLKKEDALALISAGKAKSVGEVENEKTLRNGLTGHDSETGQDGLAEFDEKLKQDHQAELDAKDKEHAEAIKALEEMHATAMQGVDEMDDVPGADLESKPDKAKKK